MSSSRRDSSDTEDDDDVSISGESDASELEDDDDVTTTSGDATSVTSSVVTSSTVATEVATDDATSVGESTSSSTVTSEAASTATSGVSASATNLRHDTSDVDDDHHEDVLTSEALETRRKNCERDFAKLSPREGKETDSSPPIDVTSTTTTQVATALSQSNLVLSYSNGASARLSSPYSDAAPTDIKGRVLTSPSNKCSSGAVVFDEITGSWVLPQVAFDPNSGSWTPVDCAQAVASKSGLITRETDDVNDDDDDRASIDSNSSYERELDAYDDDTICPQPTSSISDPGITYVMSAPSCDVTSVGSNGGSSSTTEPLLDCLATGAGDSVINSHPLPNIDACKSVSTASPLSVDSGFVPCELASLDLLERTTTTTAPLQNINNNNDLRRTATNNASDDVTKRPANPPVALAHRSATFQAGAHHS